jgi:protoporphyrinogen oxidase
MCFYRDRVSLYPYRSFYPKSGGMRGFATRAGRVLERAGVNIHNSVTIRALSLGGSPRLVTEAHGEFSPDRIVWTLGMGRLEPWLGGTKNIAAASVSVPMVLFYFAIEKSQETGMSYVNNFDETGLIFRASVPGAYGQENCPQGKSYVCCEVPAPTDGPVWQDPEQFVERVWQEALELGVAVGRPLMTRCQKARESYKAPRVDFWQRSRELNHLAAQEPNLTVAPEWNFSTNRTITDLVEQIQHARAA